MIDVNSYPCIAEEGHPGLAVAGRDGVHGREGCAHEDCSPEHRSGGHADVLRGGGLHRWFQEDDGVPAACDQAEPWVSGRGQIGRAHV